GAVLSRNPMTLYKPEASARKGPSSLADASGLWSAHVECEFRPAAFVGRLRQSEGLAEDRRFDPAVLLACGNVAAGGVPEDVELQWLVAGVDQPVFEDASLPVRIAETDGVFAHRARTDDFDDQIGCAVEFDEAAVPLADHVVDPPGTQALVGNK